MEVHGEVKDRVPLIPLAFYGHPLRACVDTGFNGALMIPRQLAEELRLDHLYNVEIETASAELVPVPVYAAEISWLGRRLIVDAMATPGDYVLMGMELLDETRLEPEPSKGVLRIIRT